LADIDGFNIFSPHIIRAMSELSELFIDPVQLISVRRRGKNNDAST